MISKIAELTLFFFIYSLALCILVQAKLKEGSEFKQDEALKFCEGIRKLLQQDFSSFNNHVKQRSTDLEGALEECNAVEVVVAHVGGGISLHAKQVIEDFISSDHGEERFKTPFTDFGPPQVLSAMQGSKAHQRIDAKLKIMKCQKIEEPRTTYFGMVWLGDLVASYSQYGVALFDKNIRNFLGASTPVNIEIQRTLEESPGDFVFLNNGVTALCQDVAPKSTKEWLDTLNSTGSVYNQWRSDYRLIDCLLPGASCKGAFRGEGRVHAYQS